MQVAEFYGIKLTDVLELPHAEIAAVLDYLDIRATMEAVAYSDDKAAKKRIKEL